MCQLVEHKNPVTLSMTMLMGFYVFLSSFPRKYLPTTEMVFPSRILSNLGKIFFIKQAIHGTGSDLDLHTLPRLICCRAPCFPPLFCFPAILARARSSFTYFVVYSLQLQYYFQAGLGRETSNLWPLLATTTFFIFFTSTSFVILLRSLLFSHHKRSLHMTDSLVPVFT